MKRYQITYRNSESQGTYHKTYALGDSDLNATLVDLIIDGNFIDAVGVKHESDNIGSFCYISHIDLLRELNVLNMNNANEDKAYEKWGC